MDTDYLPPIRIKKRAARSQPNTQNSIMVTPPTETLRLRTGFEIPKLALGTWQMPKSVTAARVSDALDYGYRHIDCAISFRNVKEVAQGVRDWLDAHPTELRENLFITCKISNNAHSRARCLRQVDQMLYEFDTTYMDVVYIHWPFGWAEPEDENSEELFPREASGTMMFSNIDFMETYRALEEAQRDGKIRSIGLTNFNMQQLERVWSEAIHKPSIIQLEMNPLFTQLPYREYCKQRDIVFMAHMPIGNPGSSVFRKHGDPNLLFNEVLQGIARNHGKSVVQVILRWIIDHGFTAAIKSQDPKRIRQNFNIFKFKLSPEEMAKIDGLNDNFRILNPIIGNYQHQHFPWPHRLPIKTK